VTINLVLIEMNPEDNKTGLESNCLFSKIDGD
jgi:hypothetical protein